MSAVSEPLVPMPSRPTATESRATTYPGAGAAGSPSSTDRQVHYLEWGHGGLPDVLCLHGGGQTAYMYEELGAALGDRYHVLAPDLPNHGDSDALVDGFGPHAASPRPSRRCSTRSASSASAIVGASLGGLDLDRRWRRASRPGRGDRADRRRPPARARGRAQDRRLHARATSRSRSLDEAAEEIAQVPARSARTSGPRASRATCASAPTVGGCGSTAWADGSATVARGGAPGRQPRHVPGRRRRGGGAIALPGARAAGRGQRRAVADRAPRRWPRSSRTRGSRPSRRPVTSPRATTRTRLLDWCPPSSTACAGSAYALRMSVRGWLHRLLGGAIDDSGRPSRTKPRASRCSMGSNTTP